MAAKKKKQPPKRVRPKRSKKYVPPERAGGGDEDYSSGGGLMQGITQNLKKVAGTEAAEKPDSTVGSWLMWLLLIAAIVFAVYQFSR